MAGNKFVLFALALPFPLYGAWQVRGVSRADLIVADPPSDKSASKEQLATMRTKTEKWVGDVRKTAAVTYQFRAPGPDDATSDADCTALARDAAKRSADLTDLESFLAGTESPTYTGTLRAQVLRLAVESNRVVESRESRSRNGSRCRCRRSTVPRRRRKRWPRSTGSWPNTQRTRASPIPRKSQRGRSARGSRS